MTILRQFFLLALLGAMGCSAGGYDGSLVSAKGQVFRGGAPLAGATVSLFPVGATSAPGSYGVSDEEGNFELKTGNNQLGVPPGDYKVVVSKLVLADGSPIPSDAETIAELDVKELVPITYRDPKTTPLQVSIPVSGADKLVVDVGG